MSKCLILVKYSIKKNQFCEDHSKNLDSIDISDKIINDLDLKSAIVKKCVREEEDGEFYETEVVDSNCLSDIIERCEKLSITYLSDLQTGIANDKQRNNAFDKLTVLLNIRKIMRKKHLQYKDDDSVFIVWG